MHLVLARIGDFDRQKGAWSDMQGQRRPPDATALERVEEGGGKMKSCGRRRDGPFVTGEDRLIIAAVSRLAAARTLDVGGEGHRAVPSERFPEGATFKIEAEGDVALGVFLGDGRGEPLGKDETVVHS